VQFVFTFLIECGLRQARILHIPVTILKHRVQHVKIRKISTIFVLALILSRLEAEDNTEHNYIQHGNLK
jgi:hypothetical protein